MKDFYIIGVMSGTSIDGLDLVYVKFFFEESWKFKIISTKTSTHHLSLEEIEDEEIEVIKVEGSKCNRCWKYKDQLINNDICDRCEDAIK